MLSRHTSIHRYTHTPTH